MSTRGKDSSGVSENRFGLSSSEGEHKHIISNLHYLTCTCTPLLHPRELAYTAESCLLRIKCQNKPEMFKRRRWRNFSTEIRPKKMQRWKLEWSFEDEDGAEIVWVSRRYSGNRSGIVALSTKRKCNQVALTQKSPVRTDILLSQPLHPASSNLRRERNDFFQNRKNFIRKSIFIFKPLWSLLNNNMQHYNPATLCKWKVLLTYSDWFTPRAPKKLTKTIVPEKLTPSW